MRLSRVLRLLLLIEYSEFVPENQILNKLYSKIMQFFNYKAKVIEVIKIKRSTPGMAI